MKEFSLLGDVLDTGVKFEIVKKNGNSYAFEAVKLGAGRETAKKFLQENPKIMKDIIKAIKEKNKE